MSLSYHAYKLPNISSPLRDLQPFSKIKLVALDLDGTLLKNSEGIPGDRIYSLKNSLNVQLTLATGRALKGAGKTLKKLNLSNKIHDKTLSSFAVILYNGSLVINPKNNSLIYHIEIPELVVAQIINVTQKYLAQTFIYVIDSSSLIVTEDMEKVYYVGNSPNPESEFNGISVTPWNNKISEPATALLIIPPNDNNLKQLVTDLKKIKDISITSSGGGYIEVRPQGSSKANGMQHWIDMPSVPYKQEEILAVGDNDVELFKWAGIGVAVNSASKAALDACDYVTKYGAEQGVIEVLNLLKQAKRYQDIEKYFL
jgi:Cof subfamily protein (haloacid dehalogenase superfamily)